MQQPSGRISVRLAMSLDGFIADESGSYDWIVPVPAPDLDTDHQLPFDDFLENVDMVVMGRHCYDQEQHRDFVALGKQVLVATSMPSPSSHEEGVQFVGPDVVAHVSAARADGMHCLLFGGGVLVSSFLAADAVDEITLGIVPVLLGSGRPLFLAGRPPLELALTDYTVEAGKVRLVYRRRARR
jgi:dihydrofolate reductase